MKRKLLWCLAIGFALQAAVWLLVAFSGNTAHPFQSCTEASEAGASLPLHVGDPGWNATLDTDHDGSAC